MIFLLFSLLLLSLPLQAQDGFTSQPLPDSIFHVMQGRSYPQGCTIARSELRYLRVRHVDAKGREKQGELVCHQSIAADLLDIFRELYRQRYPIEKIRLIDCYDADDERSMSDNNSSCFCYRKIAGQRHLSKHARGMAVDINTLYNPCVRRRPDGTLHVQPAAGAAYADRSRTSPYRIVRGDLLHRLFLKHGFRWGGAWRSVKDYQHFEK